MECIPNKVAKAKDTSGVVQSDTEDGRITGKEEGKRS